VAANQAMLAAHAAVAWAIRNGHLPPVSDEICQDCGGTAREYHHDKGYAPEHRLSVVPLCAPCHRRRHAHSCQRDRTKLLGLRRARVLKGLNQAQLADEAGLTRTHIIALERGQSSARRVTVLALAQVLGVDPFTLEGDEAFYALCRTLVDALRAAADRLNVSTDTLVEELAADTEERIRRKYGTPVSR